MTCNKRGDGAQRSVVVTVIVSILAAVAAGVAASEVAHSEPKHTSAEFDGYRRAFFAGGGTKSGWTAEAQRGVARRSAAQRHSAVVTTIVRVLVAVTAGVVASGLSHIEPEHTST